MLTNHQKRKRHYLIFCLSIATMFSCSKSNMLEQHTADTEFFNKQFIVGSSGLETSGSAFENPVSKELDEPTVDMAIAELKHLDQRDHFVPRINTQIGQPIWNESLVFTGGDHKKTIITPLYNKQKVVTGAIFGFFEPGGGFNTQVLPRTIVSRLKDTCKTTHEISKSTLKGVFQYLDSRHIASNKIVTTLNTVADLDDISNIVYTVCWYVPVVVYAPSTVVFEKQCHTEVFWGTYSEWDYYYSNGLDFIEQGSGYESYNEEEIKKAAENNFERSTIDSAGIPNPCLSVVINKLINNPTYDIGRLFGDAFKQALGSSTLPDNMHIDFKVVPVIPSASSNADGYTRTRGYNSYTIYLKESTLKDCSDLFVAKIIIHELYHVYLSHYVAANGVDDTTVLNNYASCFDAYAQSMYANTMSWAWNADLHDYMCNFLLTETAHMLQELDGNRQGYEYYWDLSWGGLQYTYVWNYYDQHPMQQESDRNCYITVFDYALTRERMDSINSYLYAESHYTANAKSDKHDNGCY